MGVKSTKAQMLESQKKTPRNTATKAKTKAKLLYARLFVNNDGEVMLDQGKGAKLAKKGNKTFLSIIGALNHLLDDGWRMVLAYNITDSSPQPSFLMNKQVIE